MRTSALFCAKTSNFFEIYGVSEWTRGLSQCEHFADKEEGVIFRDLVRMSFTVGPLSDNSY